MAVLVSNCVLFIVSVVLAARDVFPYSKHYCRQKSRDVADEQVEQIPLSR